MITVNRKTVSIEIREKKPNWYVLMENAYMESNKIPKHKPKHELSYEISYTKQEVLI